VLPPLPRWNSSQRFGLLHQERRPSPLLWRIGFTTTFRGLLGVHSRRSPHGSLIPFSETFLVVLQLICYLLNRSQCFWLERCRQPGFEPGRRGYLFKAYTTSSWKTPFGLPFFEKNWPFFSDADAGRRGAILYTIIQSYRCRGIDYSLFLL
jgi:hypothetical protein